MIHEYTNQLERTAMQLSEGEQLLDIDKACLISADISWQAFSKSPFLLTRNEAKLLLQTAKSEFGCVQTV